MPTPVPDKVKSLLSNLENPEAQDFKTLATQDDNAEKKNTLDGESMNRFDEQNLFFGFCGCNFWEIFVSPNNLNLYRAKNLKVLSDGSKIPCAHESDVLALYLLFYFTNTRTFAFSYCMLW